MTILCSYLDAFSCLLLVGLIGVCSFLGVWFLLDFGRFDDLSPNLSIGYECTALGAKGQLSKQLEQMHDVSFR